MTIHSLPTNPVRFPPNPEVEEKADEYLAANKEAFTTNQIAEAIGEDLRTTRQALYNLRNEAQVKVITFRGNNEINWIHKTYR